MTDKPDDSAPAREDAVPITLVWPTHYIDGFGYHREIAHGNPLPQANRGVLKARKTTQAAQTAAATIRPRSSQRESVPSIPAAGSASAQPPDVASSAQIRPAASVGKVIAGLRSNAHPRSPALTFVAVGDLMDSNAVARTAGDDIYLMPVSFKKMLVRYPNRFRLPLMIPNLTVEDLATQLHDGQRGPRPNLRVAYRYDHTGYVWTWERDMQSKHMVWDCVEDLENNNLSYQIVVDYSTAAG